MLKRYVYLALIGLTRLGAQTAFDPNLGSTLNVNPATIPPTYTFSWWGKAEMHYLTERSADLITWTFFPNYNPTGTNAILSVPLSVAAPRYFFRTTQFDPANPSTLIDTDSDGLPDKWEIYYFGNLTRLATDDADNDLFSARDEFAFGLNPTQSDATNLALTLYTYTANDELASVAPVSGIGLTYTPDAEGNLRTSP
jgi:hypothetical protein